MKIKYKMMAGFGSLITVIFTIVMVILSLIVQKDIEENLEHQLKTTTDSIITQVDRFIDARVSGYLRGIAEQNREMIKKIDQNPENIDNILQVYSSEKKV